jgi:cyclopropane fatty-acyl-phospholipid synthase-like methyltransferase
VASPSVAAHEGLPFANPLADADVAAAIGALNLPDGAVVVETGCGSAEMLARVLEAYPSARGVGVDLDADWLARARANLDARLPGRDVTLVHASAEEAGLEPGGYDAVVNVASSHAHGGYPAALGALAALARPGGVVLLGEGFWLREPSEEFLEALGGATRDELGTLDELHEHAGRAGLEPELVATASEDDWARYEEGLAANAQRRGDEESLAYARRILERRALPHGTTTLGFALLVLRRAA